MAITDTDGVSTNLLGHIGCGEKLEAADGGVETQADGSGICLIDLRVLLDHLWNHHTPSQGGRREQIDQLERERAEGEEQKGAYTTRIAQVVRRERTETGKERNNSRLLHGPRTEWPRPEPENQPCFWRKCRRDSHIDMLWFNERHSTMHQYVQGHSCYAQPHTQKKTWRSCKYLPSRPC